jgi:hypothetical protein
MVSAPAHGLPKMRSTPVYFGSQFGSKNEPLLSQSNCLRLYRAAREKGQPPPN